MSIQKSSFGVTATGCSVDLYTMTNHSGSSVSMINYGAIVTSIKVPDRNGILADVALGFDKLEKYLGAHGSMGDTIGRYGNRISKGRFTLDGVTYQLNINNGKNHLHGGPDGLSKKIWSVETASRDTSDALIFHYLSPDGEEHYPGNLDVTVTYTWDDDCNLTIRYQATTDKPTLCNMTNHTYFNLSGHESRNILNQKIRIEADVITPVDPGLIPLGTYMPVAGTPLDMDGSHTLGEGLNRINECPQMIPAGGYDHNYVLRKGEAVGLVATAIDEKSGRKMLVISDQPAVQLYTACTTDLADGKDGVHYGKYCGFCLETQHCPDDPNNPQFPGTTVLRPGQIYDTTTIYAFRVV